MRQKYLMLRIFYFDYMQEYFTLHCYGHFICKEVGVLIYIKSSIHIQSI